MWVARNSSCSFGRQILATTPCSCSRCERAHLRGARTNVLQGTVHLSLFVVYIALIFSP
jgi:hypothetical protein